MIKEQRQLTVQTTAKILDLLAILAEGGTRLTIRDLARKTGSSSRETRLLLVTLESRGILEWDDSRKVYRLGNSGERFAWRLLSAMGDGKRLATATQNVSTQQAPATPPRRPGRPRRVAIQPAL